MADRSAEIVIVTICARSLLAVAGLKVAVTPSGSPLADSCTGPGDGSLRPTTSWRVALPPGATASTLAVVGPCRKSSEKSGGGGGGGLGGSGGGGCGGGVVSKGRAAGTPTISSGPGPPPPQNVQEG